MRGQIMFKRFSFHCVLLMTLASSTAALSKPMSSVEVIAKIRKGLDSQLINYPSARFRSVRLEIYDDGSGFFTCGEINSKNKLGGYVGWSPFTVTGGPNFDAVVMLGDDGPSKTAINNTCTETDNHWIKHDYSTEVSAQP